VKGSEGDYPESTDQVGRSDLVTVLSLPIHEHRFSLCLCALVHQFFVVFLA
jgi:hypothetical protein